ncbi:MAG: sulfotransferase domain-containing protein [Bauldia sp.]|uniref:sulfotransferase domain-containing protein n=1 Tax=Bauldia sp. TaxID=2575872 RepID=UPI001D3513AB|nr:sulfotransferase domain-containing protein [Bauldia sp.]MCB1494511.1 sulfotransferase domain-containing protein [Bauldia sp.]
MINLSKTRPRGIIWLASYPRSGMTWVQAFIYGLVKTLSDPDFEELYIERIGDFSDSEHSAGQYKSHLGKPAFRATPAEIAAVRPKVQADIAARWKRPVFVGTHNANAIDYGYPLVNLSVSAGAVYLLRNPLDVAVSLAHFRGLSIDQAIEEMAVSGFAIAPDRENVRVVAASWSENVRSWTEHPHPVMLVTRYEDLAEKPAESFRAIARHLLMTPSDEQLGKVIAMAAFDRLREQEAADGFAGRPETSAEPFFRVGQPGRWRDVLTPSQVDRVVSAHRPMMKKFGYLPEGTA